MRRNSGPGPAAYRLPTTIGYANHDLRKIRRPEYTLGGRLNATDKRIGPAPNVYQVNTTRYGVSRANQFSISPQVPIRVGNKGPGPGAINLRDRPFYKEATPPSFTLGGRDAQNSRNPNPAPNVYTINTANVKPGIPAFSLGARTHFGSKNTSPGPAAYGTPNNNVKSRRSPEYSIGTATQIRYGNKVPGPNAYDLSAYRPGDDSKKYSFGVHHSPYSPPMVVPCDREQGS